MATTECGTAQKSLIGKAGNGQTVTLICTMHLDIGNCNSGELCRIIEKMDPEVIFEEIDLSRTDDEYYKNGHYKNQTGCSVETAAIMKYLENHQVIHIPVDTYDVRYFPKTMYNKISNANEEYDNLVNMNFRLAVCQGFLYLNSLECIDLLEKIHTIEESAVKNSNDKTLIDDYKSWQLITNNREAEMLDNIYCYSKKHGFNNAVFITGVDHKKSIMNKIQEYERTSELKLNWNYSNYENILNG